MGFFHDKKAFDRKWIAGDEEHDAALAESGVSVDALWRTSGRPVSWLVQDVVPNAAVTLIAGEPGAGKTFFACQLAADAARLSQMRVVLATSGYESAELLRWRLDQATGDKGTATFCPNGPESASHEPCPAPVPSDTTRRVVLATLTPNGYCDRRGNPTGETIDERMAILYHTLVGAGDPTSGLLPKAEGGKQKAEAGSELPRAAELLIIDDVDGWFGKPGNMLSAAALARVIERLSELARSLKVAIVVLARLQLSVEGRITARHLSRLSHAAGVVWLVVKDREQGIGHRQQEL